MRVAIYGKKVNKQTSPYFVEVVKILSDFGWDLVLEEELKQILINKIGISENYDVFNNHQDFHSGIDLAISMGGMVPFSKQLAILGILAFQSWELIQGDWVFLQIFPKSKFIIR